MVLWLPTADGVLGQGFPYEFPVVFAGDGNIGGYSALAEDVGGWSAVEDEASSTLPAVYFLNLGTGPIAVYRVEFGPLLIEVIEDTATEGIAGWSLDGFYIGVWDGLLQVTTDVIAGYVVLSEPGGLSVNEAGMLLWDPAGGSPFTGSTPFAAPSWQAEDRSVAPWSAENEVAPGASFPYTLPVSFTDDGNVDGWDALDREVG
jgi:hypothetical protein